MTEEEIKKLIDGDPHILIKKMSELGIDFSGLDAGLAKTLVRGEFGLTDVQFIAVDFVFWVAYFVERSAEELIIYPETALGARKEVMNALISKLHFGGKIEVIEKIYGREKRADLLKLMRKIQDMRNDIAHGRFDNLKYGGYHLSDNRGKLILISHLRDAFRKK